MKYKGLFRRSDKLLMTDLFGKDICGLIFKTLDDDWQMWFGVDMNGRWLLTWEHK